MRSRTGPRPVPIPGAGVRRIGSRSGFLLPLALLLLLALGTAALSVLVLARTELLLERGDLAYVQNRVRGEVRLESDLGEGADRDEAEAGAFDGGFLLLRARGAAPGPAPMALAWKLDPSREAASLPGALEVGRAPPGEGVSRLEEDCPDATGEPLVRVRSAPVPPEPDPPLPGPPRVGLLDAERIRALAVPVPPPGEGPPAGEAPGLFRVSDGARLSGGTLEGTLASEGDLILEGTVTVRGLVLVPGALIVEGSARAEGIVLVAETAVIRDDGRILGCRALAAAALTHPRLAGPHPVPGGRRLGRF